MIPLGGTAWLLWRLANHFAELVESEQVATIIVKDMSRLGREYLQVGQYTELVFPSHGIRFIAVNDGFIDKTKEYGQIENLTPEILRTFVKRIELGERDKRYSRNAPQDIVIYYRDIGLVDDLPQSMAKEENRPETQEIAC